MRAAEVDAAGLMNAVNHGQSLDAAASAAGYSVSMTPGFTRNAPASGITNQMVNILFSLKQGQATMEQTDTGLYRGGAGQDCEADPGAGPGGLCPGAAIHGEIIAK